MIGYFVFNGKCSKDYGLYISGSGTFNAPERDITKVEIPGKNGELLIDNERFKNITGSYPAFIRHKFKDYTKEVREWLLGRSGYFRLMDSYNPEYFRLASFSGPIDFETRVLNRSGECEIAFDCKPQRFLNEGDYFLPVQEGMKLYNPTPFTALPLIRVYGTGGTILVGNTVMQISSIDEYVDIDCEMQNAYKGAENCNKNVSNTFPELPEGETAIRYEGNITQVEIKPRWWSI